MPQQTASQTGESVRPCEHPGCKEVFEAQRSNAKYCAAHRTKQAEQYRHALKKHAANPSERTAKEVRATEKRMQKAAGGPKPLTGSRRKLRHRRQARKYPAPAKKKTATKTQAHEGTGCLCIDDDLYSAAQSVASAAVDLLSLAEAKDKSGRPVDRINVDMQALHIEICRL